MPEDLLDIGVDELDHLKIGKESGGLYYKGKRVQTESIVVLSPSQGFWAIVVAICAIIGAAASAASAYADLSSVPGNTAIVSPDLPSLACFTVTQIDQRQRTERIVSQRCERIPTKRP